MLLSVTFYRKYTYYVIHIYSLNLAMQYAQIIIPIHCIPDDIHLISSHALDVGQV